MLQVLLGEVGLLYLRVPLDLGLGATGPQCEHASVLEVERDHLARFGGR